jgi:hypothetical protein
MPHLTAVHDALAAAELAAAKRDAEAVPEIQQRKGKRRTERRPGARSAPNSNGTLGCAM